MDMLTGFAAGGLIGTLLALVLAPTVCRWVDEQEAWYRQNLGTDDGLVD